MKWKRIFKDEEASCMDRLSECVHEPDYGTAVLVGRQTRGRARRGREWVSPPGGLYGALFFKPDWLVQHLGLVTFLAAVAVCEAARDMSGLNIRIKWPNDLQINGQKVAGILTESSISGAELEYIVVGIGMNVNTRAQDLPEEACSLASVTGRNYDVDQLFHMVLERFDHWYEDVRDKGFAGVLERWRQLCGIFGRRVRIQQNNGAAEGSVVDVTAAGGLRIRLDGGAEQVVVSGDVVFLTETGKEG